MVTSLSYFCLNAWKKKVAERQENRRLVKHIERKLDDVIFDVAQHTKDLRMLRLDVRFLQDMDLQRSKTEAAMKEVKSESAD